MTSKSIEFHALLLEKSAVNEKLKSFNFLGLHKFNKINKLGNHMKLPQIDFELFEKSTFSN